MHSRLMTAALGLMLVWSGPSFAGLHLGMKLACKRYGQAWNSGSKHALGGVATYDFAHQFHRMPDEMFYQLPRGGSGRVLSSSKGRGSGQVTVSTPHGVMTFLLVGGGFNWRVADIIRAGDDGRSVSVKNYVDVSLTANEFMHDLKYVGGDSFHDSISSDFREAFAKLGRKDLDRVRQFLPDVKARQPYVSIRSSRACVCVRPPGGTEYDLVTFHLKRENGWKVDDYEVEGYTQIASFKSALPVIACVAALNDFSSDPDSVQPADFTVPGDLREALEYARVDPSVNLGSKGKRKWFELAEDLSSVEVIKGGRSTKIHFASHQDSHRIEKLELKTGKVWSDAAKLIAMKRTVATSGLTSAVANLLVQTTPIVVSPAVTSDSLETDAEGTTAAADDASSDEPVHEEVVENVVAADAPSEVVTAAKAEVVATKANDDSQPTIRRVEYVPVQTRRCYRRSRRIGWRRRWR